MLDAQQAQTNQVPLSNIKRIFRSQFEMELSETSLGHSKLSELLQDDRLHDICTVRLLDQGYFVIPTFIQSSDCESDDQSDGHGTESTSFSWADVEDILTTDDDCGVIGQSTFCETPCWLTEDMNLKEANVQLELDPQPLEWNPLSSGVPLDFVQNTFIHAPNAPVPNMSCRRSQSLPRCVGRTVVSPVGLLSPSEICETPEMCALRTPEPWGLSTSAPVFEYLDQEVDTSAVKISLADRV